MTEKEVRDELAKYGASWYRFKRKYRCYDGEYYRGDLLAFIEDYRKSGKVIIRQEKEGTLFPFVAGVLVGLVLAAISFVIPYIV